MLPAEWLHMSSVCLFYIYATPSMSICQMMNCLAEPPDEATIKKMRQKLEKKAQLKKKKAQARLAEQRRLAIEKRASDPNAKPCPTCGKNDHSRNISSLCDGFVPSRRVETGFKRKSTIKSSLATCCDNQPLIQVLQQTVKTCRNLSYVGSLFLNFLLVRRLGDNEAVPHINQDFVYRAFCQLVGQGSTVDLWVRDLYRAFHPLVPEHLRQQFYTKTAMITAIAREYVVNFRNHVTDNFERRTTDYFSCASAMNQTSGS